MFRSVEGSGAGWARYGHAGGVQMFVCVGSPLSRADSDKEERVVAYDMPSASSRGNSKYTGTQKASIVRGMAKATITRPSMTCTT